MPVIGKQLGFSVLLLSNQSSPNIAVLVDVFGGDREITR
jgi:hypothetical protein